MNQAILEVISAYTSPVGFKKIRKNQDAGISPVLRKRFS